jgi:hypothetical protein
MPFQNIKPLHILWQKILNVGMLDGVASGIRDILLLAGVYQEFKLKYIGRRRQPDWVSENGMILSPYKSLDWHIEWARKNSKNDGHLNGAALLDSLKENPTHVKEPRYELAVINEPLHLSDYSVRKVAGVGRRWQGAVITISSHLPLPQSVSNEFLLSTQILTMHELGHVFGLFPGTGAINPTDEELQHAHCLNDCAMYWCLDDEFCKKIKDKPFCSSCSKKLKQFFIAP